MAYGQPYGNDAATVRQSCGNGAAVLRQRCGSPAATERWPLNARFGTRTGHKRPDLGQFFEMPRLFQKPIPCRAYAKPALMKIPSVEDYEKKAA
jgi:hypothetical protein